MSVIPRNFTNHVWCVQSQHLHTLHKSFFVFQLRFYLFEIIKHNSQKYCIFSSIFNIKSGCRNIQQFGKSFKYTLLWQLSQYNLTKLFRMKLKTTKHYQSHLRGENVADIWSTQYLGWEKYLLVYLPRSHCFTIRFWRIMRIQWSSLRNSVLWVFNCIQLCSHCHGQGREDFHHPQKVPLCPLGETPHSFPPDPSNHLFVHLSPNVI